MKPKILVAGVGNIFFGDDGFGPEVVAQLVTGDDAARIARSVPTTALPESVRVVDYGIRGIHLAYDLLDGYAALVLVDAISGDGEPGEITVMEVGPDDLGKGDFDAHGMDPVAVLASLENLGGTLPPTYVVGCQPAEVERGIGLSARVAAAVPIAVQTIADLVRTLLDPASAPAEAADPVPRQAEATEPAKPVESAKPAKQSEGRPVETGRS